MTKNEIEVFLSEIQEFFPRFEVSSRVAKVWEQKAGRFSLADARQVLSDYVEMEDKAPSLAAIMARLKTRCGRSSVFTERPFTAPPAYPAVEWAMDVLGAKTVTDEIKKITEGKTLAALVESKDWVSKYKAKMEDLFLMAKQIDRMPDAEFNDLMAQHMYGKPPAVVWKDEQTRKDMFARWRGQGAA